MTVVLDGSGIVTTGVINSGTAVASTTQTAIDFTGIPAGVKRVTVLFNGVSTNGSSGIQVQLGISSGLVTSGYLGASCYCGPANTAGGTNFTTGLPFATTSPADVRHGAISILNISHGFHHILMGNQIMLMLNLVVALSHYLAR